MRWICLVAVLVIPFQNFLFASPPSRTTSSQNWCSVKQVPANIPNTRNALNAYFGRFDRRVLIQSFWGEMTSSKPRKIIIPMTQYLAQTERKPKVSAYFETMAMAVGINEPLETEIQKWPNGSTPVQAKSSLEQLCFLYSRSGGSDF